MIIETIIFFEGVIVAGIAIKNLRLERHVRQHNENNRKACKIAAEFAPKEIGDSIWHIVRCFEKIFPHIKFDVAVERAVLPLMMEKKKFEDMVINLVKNAAEAVNKDGKVVIKTQSNGDCFMFEVCDNGKGIAPSLLKKIFLPRYSSKKKQHKGLGLYSVKKDLEACGGRIEAKSESGITCFKAFVPQRKIQAVVIEDEPVLKQILTVILKKAGVSVVSFSRFEQIDYKKVDVLYLDIMLWGKSCLKEYADLRQKNPNLIIIFISGSDAHDGLKDILGRDNRAALLLKPYHESEPVDKLINLLAKN